MQRKSSTLRWSLSTFQFHAVLYINKQVMQIILTCDCQANIAAYQQRSMFGHRCHTGCSVALHTDGTCRPAHQLSHSITNGSCASQDYTTIWSISGTTGRHSMQACPKCTVSSIAMSQLLSCVKLERCARCTFAQVKVSGDMQLQLGRVIQASSKR